MYHFFFVVYLRKFNYIMGLLETARNAWTTIKNETVRRANTATRVGNAGLAIIDYVEEQIELIDDKTNERFRNRGLFSAFTLGLVSLNDVFYDNKGVAYYCIQEFEYTTGGYNPPLTDTNYYNLLTDIDITRKIDFIDWGDLAPYYTALIGRFYKVHGTGGDATSEYWYLCIQNFTGFQVDVDYTNNEYFYPISDGNTALTRRIPFIDWETDLDENYSLLKGQVIQMNGTGGDATSVYYYMCVDDITSTKTDDNPIDKPELFYDISGRTSLRNRGDFADFGYGVVMVNDVFYNDKGCGYICIQQVTYSPGGGNPPLTDTDNYRPLTTINTPQFAKDVPIDADIMVILDSTDYVWKRVPKSNLNEVHVGDSAPSYNEKVWIDNTADLLVYKSETSATITPNNTLRVDKYNSNYAGGNTVLVDYPTFDTDKHIDYDDERVVVIKNIKAGTVTFVIETGLNTVAGIEYNYLAQNDDTFDLDQNKYAEISYLYTMTSATTCDVLIRIAT